MDISIQDIRMECLKLAVYSGDESPDECLALCERYVEYVQHGIKRPAPIINMAETAARRIARQDAASLHATVMGGGYGPGDVA